MADTGTEVTTAQALDLLDQYLRFWNAGGGPERRRLAEAVFAADVEYRAPVGVLTGAEALIGFRDQFADHMGAFTLRLRDQPQVHHQCARLKWELRTGEPETSFATGTDVLRLDDQGRIRSVLAFLDRAPEGFAPEAHD